jgi:TPR repeat protein
MYWFTKSADKGDEIALCNLGFMYVSGKGVKQDYKKAIELYTKSADQGYAPALFNIGSMYENGKGVQQGNSDAQFNLELYKGDGVERNLEKVIYWYIKSAEQGNSDAQNNLALCYYKGNWFDENCNIPHCVGYNMDMDGICG